MAAPPANLLRLVPKMDLLLGRPEVARLCECHGRSVVVGALREELEDLRARIAGANGDEPPADRDQMVHAALAGLRGRLEGLSRGSLRRAINATGVVLHTGLGRAVLSDEALRAVNEVARGHCLLEADPETGERGDRLSHVEGLLTGLTGAEAALVVNNCAAAVFLALSALAAGREVVIARGQLVEIGGSFRIPDILRQSGARLVEVGTTNRVRLSDYEAAITDETALLLRVHPSNFRIIGFTSEVPLEELCALGAERGIPVMDDLGSGALIDLAGHGLGHEPTVQESVRSGVSLLTFSGDKLLGGPQAGVILGRREILARLRRHPLMRVLRVDKLTLAALEGTLRLYRDESRALNEIPTLRALTEPAAGLSSRAETLREGLARLGLPAEVEAGQTSQVGGGSLPGEELPGVAVAVRLPGWSAAEAARRLRLGDPSIWCRIWKDRLLFDVRTVTPSEVTEIVVAISALVEATP